LASVIVIQDEPAPLLVEPPPMTQRTSAQREVDELRRRLDQAGPYADIGLIIEALRHELGYRTTLTA
jgi:hypothetical protein